jgi:SPX domain protein involved in polyphosphate accumulation
MSKPHTAEHSADRTSFERIEKKFVLSREDGENLLRLITERVPPSYPKEGTRFYEIESLYFDSPELDIFRGHFQTYDGRFKLRTRTYGPNGIWDRSCIFLEMKMKRSELSEKFRLRLDPVSHEMLFQGEETGLPLSRALVIMNPSLEIRELSLRVQQVDQQLRKLKLRPCSRLLYRRRAFENESVRITLDENIRTELLLDLSSATRMEILASSFWPDAVRMQSEYPISRGLILEVKNQGTLPDWMRDFLLETKTPEARFSKFCYSITSNLCPVDGLSPSMGASLAQIAPTTFLRSVSE